MVLGASPGRTPLRAALWAILLYVVGSQWARPVRVRGISMEPVLRDGSFRLATMRRYHVQPPTRGAIVLIAMPGGRTFYTKRVVGLPGETVAFDQGTLHINGQIQAEPYLHSPGTWTLAPVVLGARDYFVVGDNRSMPIDEHVVGVVNRKNIVGGLWW